MIKKLSEKETNCLLTAVHHFVMFLRENEFDMSEEYITCSNIEKFLLDSGELELNNNLPF